MRKIIGELSRHFASVNNSDLISYDAMKSHDGWKVHQSVLLLMRGKIAEELLSRRFTDKDPTAKDVEQRAYMMVDELIRFLLNPLEKSIKRAQFAAGFDGLMGATSRKQPKGKRK